MLLFCNSCEEYEQEEDFYRMASNKARNGRSNYCKKCTKNRTRSNPEDYDALFAEQEGRCWICKKTQNIRLCVDHDHETDQVRGLLCISCNTALGKFKDDETLLLRAIEYLNKPDTGIMYTRSAKRLDRTRV